MAAQASLNPGDVLGDRYSIIGPPLYVGPMSVVYRAQHLALKRECVVKIMQVAPNTTNNDALKRFEREAEILCKLDQAGSSYFPRIYDQFIWNGNPVIVLQRKCACTLEEWLTRNGGACNEKEALQIIESVILGLRGLHDLGYIHRDIKPSNIMINQPGLKIGLLDLGVAFELSSAPANTAPVSTRGVHVPVGDRIGTPGYAAPEIYDGFTSAASDIYSVGVVLAYLLTMEEPGHFLIPKSVKSLSPAMRTIIETATAREPEDRYTLDTMLVAVRELLQPSRASAPLPTQTAVSNSWWQRLWCNQLHPRHLRGLVGDSVDIFGANVVLGCLIGIMGAPFWLDISDLVWTYYYDGLFVIRIFTIFLLAFLPLTFRLIISEKFYPLTRMGAVGILTVLMTVPLFSFLSMHAEYGKNWTDRHTKWGQRADALDPYRKVRIILPLSGHPVDRDPASYSRTEINRLLKKQAVELDNSHQSDIPYP